MVYHHLFRACLNAELRLESAELIPELHRRASSWFQRTGEVTEAIDHAMAGQVGIERPGIAYELLSSPNEV
jgi:LuxR family transcriptional regulator, maltose regulon positive regulatory protein